MRGDVRKGPGARALAQRWEGLRGRDEGQIGLLVLGMTIIAILLILTTAAITAVSLARMRLLDAADSAALVAANAFEDATYATTGVGSAVPVSDASVQRAAADLPCPAGRLLEQQSEAHPLRFDRASGGRPPTGVE